MKTTLMLAAWLFAVAHASPTGAAPNDAETEIAPDAALDADAAAIPHSLDRIVLIGASASDGFGTQLLARLPDSGRIVRDRTNLEAVLRAALRHEGAEIRRFSSSMFFTQPVRTGRQQIDAALQLEPTVVVAVDFLFWFGYGRVEAPNGSEAEVERRLARLEQGLTMLNELECPVIVGDFPDMSAAVGFMLSTRQMPSPNALAALNQRVHAWIADNEHAHHFPLGPLVADIRAGRPLEIAGRTWDRNEVGRLLGIDALHPTTLGLIATAQKVGEVMADSLEDVLTDHFQSDPKMVLKALHEDLIERTRAADGEQAAEPPLPVDVEPPTARTVDQTSR